MPAKAGRQAGRQAGKKRERERERQKRESVVMRDHSRAFDGKLEISSSSLIDHAVSLDFVLSASNETGTAYGASRICESKRKTARADGIEE